MRLRGSRIKDDPLKYLQLLPNLIDVNLVEEAYEGEALVFSLKGFPKLKMLRLHDLTTLRWIVIEPNSLPQLQELMIGACPHLEGVPLGMKHLNILTTLSLSNTPAEAISSTLPENGPYYSAVEHVYSHLQHSGKQVDISTSSSIQPLLNHLQTQEGQALLNRLWDIYLKIPYLRP